ncbi:hypothetical protein Ae406Ps2_0277 [Pseudonocardia sp. Ae406_Ps2]|uniref:DUF1905 domain-containing protein n=1 Tax=unclassified Pseudonocardia TaxID=2619320 RepID=UPI0002E9A7DF|nr:MULTISPECIES: DUF1905 domain-containing protein [unclassified Pseudonocardia]OLM00277.1 hypothetical protein Ae406Ps2_0277 [Pseudonocardia sp. Ae406_Ps2]OLM07929.1 hypothetical protein Ae331Ps2_5639c [Pseudonocardia sp. Ae331_Ps2]OLM13820.1 hypothetical protein Ae505Ps2_3949 [Pseudonocardia sp. Ae505_Ps2]OLM21849.1 hypothetical protein Ae706Ps2_0281 [Pseudonocardia sp. Ae706_Ps2]OLM30938.1 hypothetical protein Ae717Ps2_1833 [Pseudonocardia sp. Ae717_Ps2]
MRIAGEIVHWRGPAPYHFVRLPDDAAAVVADVARDVTYGWGMVPVDAVLGATRFSTSLFPRDGGFLLPVKDAVRRAEEVEVGDVVQVELEIRTRR